MVQLHTPAAVSSALSPLDAPLRGGFSSPLSPLERGVAALGNALERLPHDGQLFLDTRGQLHTSKGELLGALSDGALPVLHVVRGADGSALLGPGLASAGGTYLRPPTDRHRERLQDRIVVPGGTELFLSRYRDPVVLPTGSEPEAPADTILGGLQRLTVGGPALVIGRRSHPELTTEAANIRGADTVSRVHLHVSKVRENPPCFSVRDGLEGALPVLAVEEERGRIVTGPVRLREGMSFTVGEMGPSFTYRTAETIAREEEYTNSLASIARAPWADIRHRHVRDGDYTHAIRNRLDREDELSFVHGRMGSAHDRADLMERFIRHGANLVAKGSYHEALDHLRNVRFLELCGIDIRVEENHYYELRARSLDRDGVAELLRSIAADSWFRTDQRLVYPSTGAVGESCYELIDRLELAGQRYEAEEKRQLVREFEHGCCLLHLEEYIHGLQLLDREAGGRGLVSRGAALIRGADPAEVDVVYYLSELGVGVSTEELLRYENRYLMHRLRSGVQAPGEQEAIEAALAALPPGARLMLLPEGSEASVDGSPYVHRMRMLDTDEFVRSTDPEGLRPALARELLRAERELASGMSIEKDLTGSFVLHPGPGRAPVLVPDDRFRLAPLAEPTTVLQGTFVNFGFYRFRV